jgi:hypothetical protein
VDGGELDLECIPTGVNPFIEYSKCVRCDSIMLSANPDFWPYLCTTSLVTCLSYVEIKAKDFGYQQLG